MTKYLFTIFFASHLTASHCLASSAVEWNTTKKAIDAVKSYYDGYSKNDHSRAKLDPNLVFRDPVNATNSKAEFLKMVAPVYKIFRDISGLQIQFDGVNSVVTAKYNFVVRTCPDKDVSAPMVETFSVGPQGITRIDLSFNPQEMFPCGLPQ